MGSPRRARRKVLIKKYSEVCELCTTIVEIFRSLRKFCKSRKLRIRIFLAPSRQDAKFSKVFGFLLSAFAPLREIFRFLLVAAQPR